MTESVLFEPGADFATCRIVGEHTLEEGVALVTAAIMRTRELGIGKLLVDVGAATGFDPPSLAARHWFMNEWAKAARSEVRIAMVARAEHIHAERFGVIAGRNFGMESNVFEEEDQALAWLLR
jgi:hypothetical protein